MDILSIANSTSPAIPISDRVSGGNLAHQAVKTAAPVETDKPVAPSGLVQQAAGREQVLKAVHDINKTIQAASQNLEFSVDHDSDQIVVKVIDQQTKQVLRQIPTEEALEIAKSLDKLQGLLIKQTA
ncbi:MAG: flagellar protein FlaG [Burkholderiales bacterium]|nr:flagellar protein FlaG [Burkholderiales bacterium]